MGKLQKGLALRFGCVRVNHDYGLGGIRIVVLIAKCGCGFHDTDDAQTIQFHAIHFAVGNAPGEDCLIAGEVQLAIGDTRARPYVCIARFDVVAGDLLGLNGD